MAVASNQTRGFWTVCRSLQQFCLRLTRPRKSVPWHNFRLAPLVGALYTSPQSPPDPSYVLGALGHTIFLN
jgi:hypothetical protein